MSSSIVSSWRWQFIAVTLLLSAVPTPLRAQNVVDGLPPPPTLPTIEPALPPEFNSPASTPPPASSAPAVRPARPATPARPAPARSQAYLVYVNGDSPLLLAQVRRVQSNAFVDNREGQAVIQAGVFDEADRAEQQIAILEQQGIGAEIARITRTTPAAASPPTAIAANNLPPDLLPDVPVDRQLEFGQPLTTPPTTSRETIAQNNPTAVQDSSYYVAIPGRLANLPDISNLVTLLGSGLDVPERAVQELRSPRGPHVLVGPFVDRRTANRWNRYFRDFGMDARVYYRR